MNHIRVIIIACTLFYSHAFGQEQEENLSDLVTDIHLLAIKSVYGETWVADNPEAVSVLQDCFLHRMNYVIEPLTATDKYPSLSSFPLMNKNNPSIVAIDYSQFNPSTFTPIIYCLPFFSDQTQVIRVDGTDYIIIIEPVKTRN
ncbi:hypothetical protein [Fluviicola sp.]|uniref:hypothetical protein n=1 Tax=Fluviicola sp. TaxID=1917219 RepID=UPI0031CE3C67